jgi:hypothetical protein
MKKLLQATTIILLAIALALGTIACTGGDSVSETTPPIEATPESMLDSNENDTVDENEEFELWGVTSEGRGEEFQEGFVPDIDAASFFSWDVPEDMEDVFVPDIIKSTLFDYIFDLDQMVDLGYIGYDEHGYFWVWNKISPFNISALLTLNDPNATEEQNEQYQIVLALISSLKSWYDSDVTNSGPQFWGILLQEWVNPDHEAYQFWRPLISSEQWDLLQKTLNDFHSDLEMNHVMFASGRPDWLIDQRVSNHYPFRGVIDFEDD